MNGRSIDHLNGIERFGRHIIVTGPTQSDVLRKVRALTARSLALLAGPMPHEHEWIAVLESERQDLN